MSVYLGYPTIAGYGFTIFLDGNTTSKYYSYSHNLYSGNNYNQKLEDFKLTFISSSSNPKLYYDVRYMFELTDVCFFVKEINNVGSFLTSYYLDDNYTVSGVKVGSRLDKDTISLYFNNSASYGTYYRDFSVVDQSYYEKYSKSMFVENRENAYVLYIPVYYNNTSNLETTYNLQPSRTLYYVYVLVKKSVKQPTDCCLDVEMYPDKYYLI